MTKLKPTQRLQMGSFQDATTLEFQGNTYYLPSRAFAYVERDILFDTREAKGATVDTAFTPATVYRLDSNLSATSGQAFAQVLDVALSSFIENDDVINRAFFQTILIDDARQLTPAHFALPEIAKVLSQKAVKRVISIENNDTWRFPIGPYFMTPQGLRSVFKLCQDQYEAFTTPIVKPLRPGDPLEQPTTGQIPVPSRLYYTKQPSMPLAGLRFAIKDVIDVAGIPTTNCCRSYEQLRGLAQETATCVSMLMELGATPVGKTRTTQFASGARPCDWKDYLCPFNPRGDGRQSPSMSSAGSAAATAGYDWLDLAIGTDTFGSVTFPAAANGLFSLRPTLGAMSTHGVIALSKHLDTIGFLARDIKLSAAVVRAWLRQSPALRIPEKPDKILFPTDLFPFKNVKYQATIESFVKQLGDSLEVEVQQVSLSDRWAADHEAEGTALQDYLRSTLAHIQLYDCYHNNESFRDDYQAKYGVPAYVDPVIDYKWSLGSALTETQYKQAVHELDTFQNWLGQNVMSKHTWMIIPIGIDAPSYRDTYVGSAEESGRSVQGFGFSGSTLPSLTGMPAFTIPVGQFDYRSSVTKRSEKLPIIATIMASRGCDTALLNALTSFYDHHPDFAGVVATGAETFPNTDSA